MSIFKRFARSDFFIRLRNWEYWPFGILQFPIFFHFLWLAFRARSLMFFSASNPGITMGGMFGESKHDVLKKIPSRYLPKTILIHLPCTANQVVNNLVNEGYNFPVIFKPDLGERGIMVKKIASVKDIENYIEQVKIDFLVQELVDLPLEFGVFYCRFPSEAKGKVISIVKKEMLSVTGDGVSTLQQLILNKDRAKLQWKKLKDVYFDRLEEIIPTGKRIEIVSIGNHSMGTKFLNGSDLINEQLSSVFDNIAQQIDGFYFGRFDIRCNSLDDFYNGKIKILELNGCGAEPAHIYDPNFRLRDAVKELVKHWTTLFEIARQNRERGVRYLSIREGISYYRKFKEATRQ